MRVQMKSVLAVASMCMFAFLLETIFASTVEAQMVRTRTPFRRSGSSFNERIGVGFGFNLRGSNQVRGIDQNGNFTPNGDIQFRQGGAGAAVPNVGGGNPNAAARTGFALLGKNGEAFFNLSAGQGSRRTSGSSSPSVTTLNGYPGYFSAGSQRPFVTSVIPIVGDNNSPLSRPGGRSVLSERLSRLNQSSSGKTAHHSNSTPQKVAPEDINTTKRLNVAQKSTAGRAELSLAEIAKQQQNEDDQVNTKVNKLIEEATAAEKSGNIAAAKNYLRTAARTATGSSKQDILNKLRALSTRSKSRIKK